MLLGIKYMLEVTNMSAAVAFYRDTFGLEVEVESDFWSELAFGGAVVALHGGRETADLVKTGLSFTVDDIERAVAAVADHGGRVMNGPFKGGGDVLLAEFVDLDNNYFMASQTVTASTSS